MTRLSLFGFPAPAFAPEDGAGAAAAALATTTAAAAGDAATGAAATTTTATETAAASAKWYEGQAYDAETRDWLKAKGFTKDDPTEALALVTRSARSAERLIGKGPETLLERPTKDQSWSDWRRANAEALGLPKDLAGYEVKAPDSWPKDMAWDAALEAKAREFAFAQGIDPDVHKGYVGLFAAKMQGLAQEAQTQLAEANEKMMRELQLQHGDKTDGLIAQARQAAQALAAQAGLSSDQLARVTRLIAKGEGGDAAVIRLFAAVAAGLGEDTALGLGKGDDASLGMTPAQAKAELDRLQAPDGEFGKAFAANDRAAMARLAPRRDALARIAASAARM